MKNSKHPIISEEVLQNKIYFLRSQKIMLDRDLAILYGVPAIRLRQQVKRNISRFPTNFMFQLTKEEAEIMVSQFVIPSKKHLGGTLPYAFTEHGILMLANILKSKQAIQMSVRIIEIFIRMREFMLANKAVFAQLKKLEMQVGKNNGDIKKIFSILRYLLSPDAKK